MKKTLALLPILALLIAGCSLAGKSASDDSQSAQPAFALPEQANRSVEGDVQINTQEEQGRDSQQVKADWIPFESSYFTLSFKIPQGFEVKENQDHLLVAKSPYYTLDIGSDNAFLALTRYDENNTRERAIALYKKTLKNWEESSIVIDGSTFLAIKGIDVGSFEGDSAGRVVAVFFDASWLQIVERPANQDQDFDPIAIGNEILSTFKFSNKVSDGWQTFRSNDYSFGLRYPGDSLKTETAFGQKVATVRYKDGAVIREEALSDKYSLEIHSREDSSEAYHFNIIVYPDTDKTFSGIKKEVFCPSENAGATCEEVKLNSSVDAYRVTFNSTQAVPGSDYHFIYKGNYYVIQHSLKPAYGSNINNFGEEILKTLTLF